MESIKGVLKKLSGEWNSPINYYFNVNEEKLFLNPAIGRRVVLSFTGNIYCIQCGRKTNKSFQQGFCYVCLKRLQECNLCMIHPERCQIMSEKGCPENDWAHQHCHQEHVVYLANSSDLKVGITRDKQKLYRWIDQGARQALPIFHVPNRYLSGLIEVDLKNYLSDRTNWRKLLTQEAELMDLVKERDRIYDDAQEILAARIKEHANHNITYLRNETPITLSYPILEYPTRVKSLSLDQTAVIESELLGIKGQYFILKDGVINIRKFGGYEVEFTVRS
jgi:hypothetical protein